MFSPDILLWLKWELSEIESYDLLAIVIGISELRWLLTHKRVCAYPCTFCAMCNLVNGVCVFEIRYTISIDFARGRGNMFSFQVLQAELTFIDLLSPDSGGTIFGSKILCVDR